MVQTYLRDLLARALHTFWQTFFAALATLYAGGGLDVHDLSGVTDWHRVIVALIAAAGAAVLSAVKTTALGLRGPKTLTDAFKQMLTSVRLNEPPTTPALTVAPSEPPATPGSTEATPATPEVKP